MKKTMKRIISLLLVILLIGTLLVGCKKDNEENIPTDTVASGEVDDFPNIARQNNGGKDFNILYPMWSLYERYYFALEANGELINDANFERQAAINEYLGINIVGLPIMPLIMIDPATKSKHRSYISYNGK